MAPVIQPNSSGDMTSDEDDVLECLAALFNLEPEGDGDGENGDGELQPQGSPTLGRERTSREKVVGNSLIMEKIGQFLPPKDLLNVRETHEVWNMALAPELRTCHREVKITPHSAPIGIPASAPNPEAIGPQGQGALESFVSLIEKSGCIPFSRYNIQDISFNSQFATRFFSVCGEFMTVLKITLSDISVQEFSIQDFRNIMRAPRIETLEIYDRRTSTVGCWNNARLYDAYVGFPETKKTPSLASLTFESGTLRHASAEGFLIDLFQAAHNLRFIHIMNRLVINDNGDEPFPNTNLPVLTALAHKPFLRTVKNLKLYNVTGLEMEMLVTLSERTTNMLRVHDLFVQYKRSDILTQECGNFLSGLLYLHRNRLKQLDIEVIDTMWLQPGGNNFAIVQIPEMRKLEMLSLNVASHVNALFNFASFPTTFPSMKFAVLHQHDEDLWRHHTDPHLTCHPRMEILFLRLVNHDYDWTRMFQVFSNIVELNLALDQLEGLRKIFAVWTQLQILTVYSADPHSPERVDELVTGIPTSFHVELATGKLRQENMESYKQWPGVTDLKKLREFTLLHSYRGRKPAFIREESFNSASEYFGFNIPGPGSKLTKIGIQHTYQAGPSWKGFGLGLETIWDDDIWEDEELA